MSTKLWIDTVNDYDIQRNFQLDKGGEYLELSEDFLYKVVVNEEKLQLFLSKEEIELIRPNWGEIQLQPTSVLIGSDREVYLTLLKEAMKTNSLRKVNAFLYEKNITSDKLIDRAKSPVQIKSIIERIQNKGIFDNTFIKEFDQLIVFLNRKIKNKEKVLIEFCD